MARSKPSRSPLRLLSPNWQRPRFPSPPVGAERGFLVRKSLGAAFLLLALGGLPAGAQDKPGPAEPPARAETRHTITLAGRALDYRAIAETIGLTDTTGEPTASIYTVSYLAEAPAGQRRPVAFVFNGGPGAGSVFLPLGALGPRLLD